jgi:hypothetical protein
MSVITFSRNLTRNIRTNITSKRSDEFVKKFAAHINSEIQCSWTHSIRSAEFSWTWILEKRLVQLRLLSRFILTILIRIQRQDWVFILIFAFRDIFLFISLPVIYHPNEIFTISLIIHKLNRHSEFTIANLPIPLGNASWFLSPNNRNWWPNSVCFNNWPFLFHQKVFLKMNPLNQLRLKLGLN